MKRLLLLLCATFWAVPGFAQGGFLKQSTSVTLQVGPFLDSVDGVTPKTALSITQATVLISKAGAALSAKNDASTCPHDAGGFYRCTFNTTDTNTQGAFLISVQIATSAPVWHFYTVQSASAYAATVTGGLLTFPKNTAHPNFPITFFATTGARQAGLTTGQITCNVFLDGGGAIALTDTTETELDATSAPGVYLVDLSAAEDNGNDGIVVCKTNTGLVAQTNFQTQH